MHARKNPPTAEITHQTKPVSSQPLSFLSRLAGRQKLQPGRATLSQFSLKSTLVKKLAKQSVKPKTVTKKVDEKSKLQVET